MQSWNSFVAWLTAVSNRPVVFGAVVLVIAIIVASLLAARISRAAIRGLLEQRDRELKAAVIAALVDAATEASVWNSLSPQEQIMADRAVGQADIQVRLLPIRGSAIAANWASHQLADLKRTSATFGYQLEPAVLEFRDRLIEWQNRPARARKIFQGDLDRWKLQNSTSEKSLIAEQDAWVAQQHHDDFNRLESTATAAATSAPAPAPEQAQAPAPTPARALGPASAPAPNPAPTPALAPALAPAPTPERTTSAYAPYQNAPSTETQRLLDDVEALEVRPSEPTSAEVPAS